MDNKKTPPLVTIQSNIAEDTDAGNDSDTTVRFSPVTQQTSPTPTTHCEKSIEPSQYFSPNEKTSPLRTMKLFFIMLPATTTRKIAAYACDPKQRIKKNQRSTNKLQTALHVAVKRVKG
jgi:hypothetical protein